MGCTPSEIPFDLHIQLASDILSRVYSLNEDASEQRKFELRIGVNDAYSDVVYQDSIERNWNIAGAGINRAQRVMSLADPSQIIVTDTVYNNLGVRSAYKESFRGPYASQVKHGERVTVWQYVNSAVPGLNTTVASKLEGKETS